MLAVAQKIFYSWELNHRKSTSDESRFTGVLSEAKVDLNPHQIEAALFAFKSPLSKGAILADEVGLGKTIEAGIILSELWAERRRKILVIVPASLRNQWSIELYEKFYLPSLIIERGSYEGLKTTNDNPFISDSSIVICSYNFATIHSEEISNVQWDLVVYDEAHKLRNVYKKGNVIANTLKEALKPFRKLLLTATPLQNNLKELYGLISIIDEEFFASAQTFEEQYNKITTRDNSRFGELKSRISRIVHRTLRSQVKEYVNYTRRIPFVQEYYPTGKETRLYLSVSDYLMRENTYGIPDQIRPLMTMLIWKIMSSSTYALINTLNRIVERLEDLKSSGSRHRVGLNSLFQDYDVSVDNESEPQNITIEQNFSQQQIDEEIEEINDFIRIAKTIDEETKARELLKALQTSFLQLQELGAQKKALIFTESCKTQEYLKSFLEAHGYSGKIVCFNGTNNNPDSKRVYNNWLLKYGGTQRATGNVLIDKKQALVDAFESEAEIMIATEAGAEGINLQFCSLVVNYDMPWNPQRIEQRIGRCHRYGQKFDVIVMNFVNKSNAADCRVYELLSEKFNLFDGVFGSSDEVLGALDSSTDFEKRILSIYRTCRTEIEINTAFDILRKELEDIITARISETKKSLLENFDEDVVNKLKIRLADDKEQLSNHYRKMWILTKSVLDENICNVNEQNLSFHLCKELGSNIPAGDYSLNKNEDTKIQLRLGHPLGQYIIQKAMSTDSIDEFITFDLSNHMYRSSYLEKFKGISGWMIAYKVCSSNSYDGEETLIFCPISECGELLPSEFGYKLMGLSIIDCTAANCPSEVETLVFDDFNTKIKKYSEDLENRTAEYANYEIEKYESWSDDKLVPLQNEVIEIRKEKDAIHRQLRKEINVRTKLELKRKELELSNKLSSKQKQLFILEDQYRQQVDYMTDRLLKALENHVESSVMFKIGWKIL